MANKAREIITPTVPGIFRTVFLYVGQGDATLMAIPDGENYKYVLIDSNHDESCDGIDILKLLKDLVGGKDEKLDLFVNTHPHKDHLSRVKAIYEEVGIKQLWHSGHKPGGDFKDVYDDLASVMKKLGDSNVFRLRGTRADNELDGIGVRLGDVSFNVLAPADYVAEEIEGEKPADRYRRIHEQCSIIRFKYGTTEKQILITGDADYLAWKDHIADYHKERLPSTVLSAAHHGSNSFFWDKPDAEGEPYLDHLKRINPKYVVVSAPRREESKHGHPDKKAIKLYEDVVTKDGLLHLGLNRECVIVDIDRDGNIDVRSDKDLVDKYGTKNCEDDKGGMSARFTAPAISTRIDHKPMGI